MDAAAIKERQREIWGLGDYSYISRLLRPAAAALCDACAGSAGQEVLGVAAGDGNFALACAREGARVVASDISPAMVERGRAHSEAEGYPIESVEADAEELPFEDGSSTAWAPVFGAMLAPRPDVAARELFRVVRPGGTVGMTAFTPGSFADEQFEIGRRYGPSQPSQPRAVEWGIEETVRSRFKGLAPGWSSRSGLSRWRRRHQSSSSPSRRPRPGAGRPPAGRSRVSDSTPCGVAEATVRCESTTSTS